MPLIPDAVIDEIQTRADIVELIGRYVPLKRAGRHFKANCPFHKEKTPSFMVNTDKQIFHCFGCGAGGNIFSFLIQHDRLTFPEAVRQLADHVGVPLPERESSGAAKSQDQLVALMEQACRFFERTLFAPAQGKAARAYVAQRGVSEETQKVFRLGFAPPGWDHLLKAAHKTGMTPERLEAAGLAVKGKSGSGYYDRFRNRLIFPILDVRGRVVGFGGRSLDGREPKYLNSPETAIYSKGRQLFGLAQAKDAILKTKTAIIVEGYFDCVVLAGAGIAHVVSPLGTALTVDQAKLLKRYAESVILAFDPDAAGEAATLRGIDLLVEAGLHVHVARLPSGVDPDECLRASGRERFEQLLHASVNIFDFLVDTALRRYPRQDTEQKVQAAQFILPTIAKVPDAMLRSEYVRLLAERLHLDESAVATELAKAQPRHLALEPRTPSHRGQAAGSVQAPASRLPAEGPERLLTALVLDEPLRWKQAQGQVSFEDISDPSLRSILEIIDTLDAAGKPATPAQVVSRLSDTGEGGLVTELVAAAQIVTAKEQAFEECVRRVRAKSRERLLDQLRQQIHAAQTAGTDTEMRELLTLYQQHVKGG